MSFKQTFDFSSDAGDGRNPSVGDHDVLLQQWMRSQ